MTVCGRDIATNTLCKLQGPNEAGIASMFSISCLINQDSQCKFLHFSGIIWAADKTSDCRLIRDFFWFDVGSSGVI